MADLKPYQIADETFIIPSTHPVPGRGVLHMNSMVIRGQEPMLLDTGMPVRREPWLEMAFSLVNPADVRWIFLSHDDRDHSGNLMQVLERCPNATLLAHFMVVGRLAEEYDLPMNRIRFVNDGESFSIGDRTLIAIRPPVFDSPGTRGVWDAKTGVYYCVDAFGA
ncbi:MAG: MBL fold metallo-hydrolase, partial [Chloroflexi bacterium]|nr:MBL fold metallo-hydrolase [Chloroflexota bacterium]